MKRLIVRAGRGVILHPHWLRLMRDIRRRGWSSISLCDDQETTFWTYTIGFDESLNHPEIVTSGYTPGVTEKILAGVYSSIKRGDLTIENGLEWEVCGLGRFAWREVNWLRITDDWVVAARLRRWERTGSPAGLRVYQLVAADPAGVLPWEPGYDAEFGAQSPQLWRPPPNTKVAAALSV